MNGFAFLVVVSVIVLLGAIAMRLFDRRTEALVEAPAIRSAQDQRRIEHEIVGALYHAAVHAKCPTLRVNMQIYASELGAGYALLSEKRFTEWRAAVTASTKALRGTRGHAAAQRACVLAEALETYLVTTWRKPAC